jgi:hypothetical protein
LHEKLRVASIPKCCNKRCGYAIHVKRTLAPQRDWFAVVQKFDNVFSFIEITLRMRSRGRLVGDIVRLIKLANVV